MNQYVFMKNHTLPLPYKGFVPSSSTATLKRFNEYSRLVYSNVQKHTLSCEKFTISERIHDSFSFAREGYGKMRKWMLRHHKIIRYVDDFSYIAFAIQIDEKTEEFQFLYPNDYSISKILYPQFVLGEFERMNNLQRLGWLERNCEFIPFRVVRENIICFPYESYLFSHIKRNEGVMNNLSDWIAETKPRLYDNRRYFIVYSYVNDYYYLKKDIDSKKESES